MKKFLSLLLTVALLAALSGVPALAQAPAVLAIGSVRSVNPAWFEFPVIKRICEKLNITLDFTQYDADTFNLMLAGGGLADIVVGDGAYTTTILNNKIAMNIYPLLDEYAPNIKNGTYKETIGVMQTVLELNDDELYMLAPWTGVENDGGCVQSNRGYVLRWDYYKELGCPEINSDDDYIAVIKAMQANHPLTDDGKRTYGSGVERDLGAMGGYRASFVSSNYTNPWSFGSYKFKSDLVTSELYDGYTDVAHSSYWTDMAFYNKVYLEGLFDEDCFIMTKDEYNAKIANGTYMGLHYRSEALYNEEKTKDPATTKGFVVIPSKAALSFSNKLSLLGNFPSGYTFIPAESKNWALSLAFMNELYDADNLREICSGIRGEYWDYDENGKPYVFDETFVKLTAGELNWADLSGMSMFLPYNETTRHPDGSYYNLFAEHEYRSKGLSPLQQDFCDYYGMSYPGDLSQKLADAGETIDMSNDRGQTISACISNIPMDIKRILDNCNDILDRAMPRLIMAANAEKFAEVQSDVMAQLAQADEQTAWNWAIERWNAAQAKIDPIWMAAKQG